MQNISQVAKINGRAKCKYINLSNYLESKSYKRQKSVCQN